MVSLKRAAFELILGASNHVYPREFIGLLRGDLENILEVLVIPQSIRGEGFASVRWANVGFDKSIIGSVHSHPSGNAKPSSQDLLYFRKTGKLHLIAAHPYKGLSDLACFDGDGNILELKLVD